MIEISTFKEHIYDVVGAIYEVHKRLGPGLNEYVYQEGLELELQHQLIPFQREKAFHPIYRGQEMKAEYRLDFLCKEDVIVELKSVSEICDEHRAQLFNYLRLTNAACGILVNFSPRFAVVERYFYDSNSKTLYNTYGASIQPDRQNKSYSS